MHRYFVDEGQILEDIIKIQGNDVRHIKDVLRLKIDDLIEVVSEGFVYEVRIEHLSKSEISTRIIDKSKGKNEPRSKIRLFQGLAKGSKMETVFQKGTEIGIDEFYPLLTKRTVVKIENEKKEKSKITRWNTITEDASKQAKRDKVPKVMDILSFDNMIQILKEEDNILVAYEDEQALSIKEVLKSMDNNRVNIIIGPEGGFDPEEIEKLREIGGKVVSLGRRILRTETAGLVTAAVILYEKDDLGVV